MLTVFQVSFYVGIGLTLLSFLFGNLFDFLGIDGLDMDLDIGINISIPISPTLILLFLTVFGGVGWIITDNLMFFPSILLILIALVAGILVCILVAMFIIKPLKKAQNTSAPDKQQLIGLRAKVTETIFKEGFGEISYVVNGNSYTSPAKSTDGNEIKMGNEVAICWIEEHVFFVISMEDI